MLLDILLVIIITLLFGFFAARVCVSLSFISKSKNILSNVFQILFLVISLGFLNAAIMNSVEWNDVLYMIIVFGLGLIISIPLTIVMIAHYDTKESV